MTTESNAAPFPAQWNEGDTETFIELGRYVVPEREYQIETMCDLIPATAAHCNIMELCCGEGLLAEAMLERFPNCTVFGYDGSAGMLDKARKRLESFGERFQPVEFDLSSRAWRQPAMTVHAVVSSLTIHHLDGAQKMELYADLFKLLNSDGVLVIADLVECAHPLGQAVAAKAWDKSVRNRAMAIDGHTGAFDWFEREHWNIYKYPEPYDIDHPSRLLEQLKWLEQAGFADVDVYWMLAGQAIFGGRKPPT